MNRCVLAPRAGVNLYGKDPDFVGVPEWRSPRYCQAILSQVRVGAGRGHAMYLISAIRKPAGGGHSREL